MKKLIPAMAMLAAAPMLGAQTFPQDGAPSASLALQPIPHSDDLEVDEVQALDRQCDDRTWQAVQRDRAQPSLDRRPADPDEPILFKAVDHEVEGCAVLLVGDGDIRPLPAPQNGPLLQPAQ